MAKHSDFLRSQQMIWYLCQKNWADAMVVADGLRRSHPGAESWHLAAYTRWLFEMSAVGVAEMAKKAIELDPAKTKSMLLIANALMDLGRSDEALSWVERGLRQDDEFRLELQMAKAWIHHWRFELEQATELIGEVRRQAPHNTRALWMQARIVELGEKMKRDRAATLDSLRQDTVIVCQRLLARGRYQQVMSLTMRLLRVVQNPALSKLQAIAQLELNQLQDALTSIGEVLAHYPGDRESTRIKAICLYKTGKLDDALAMVEEMLTGRPDEGLLLLKADILLKMRDYSQAKGLYERLKIQGNATARVIGNLKKATLEEGLLLEGATDSGRLILLLVGRSYPESLALYVRGEGSGNPDYRLVRRDFDEAGALQERCLVEAKNWERIREELSRQDWLNNEPRFVDPSVAGQVWESVMDICKGEFFSFDTCLEPSVWALACGVPVPSEKGLELTEGSR